jgi:hypothetical protein
MKNQRIALVDGSYSLFRSGGMLPPSSGAATTKMVGGSRKGDIDSGDHGEVALGLQPIPRFGDIVGEVVKEVVRNGEAKGREVVGVEVGIVCDLRRVGKVMRMLHSKVLQQLDGR